MTGRDEFPAGDDLWAVDPSSPPQWTPVASGQARGTVVGHGLPGLEPLRVEFDFGVGGGFVVARTAADLELPEDWEMRLRVRGAAPANGLEIKLVDPAGTSVWRWKREGFAPAREWMDLRVAGHAFEFAWGPAGGGAPLRVGAVEFAIIATPGGSGRIEVTDLRVVDRGRLRFASVTATSCAPGFDVAMAVDGDPGTGWRSADGDVEPALDLEFDDERDVGGVVVRWGEAGAPRSVRVETRGDDGVWTERYRAQPAGAAVSFVPLAAAGVRALRVAASGGSVAVHEVALKPYGWSSTPSEFLTNVARESSRGLYPRFLTREQALWTPVASPASGPVGLLGEDGAVEVGRAGFSLEPSLFASNGQGEAKWISWAGVDREALLPDAPLPVPTVRWRAADLDLDITAVVDEGSRVLVRYRVRNGGAKTKAVTLFVAVRPYQGTPPWQAWRDLGGPSPVHSLVADAGTVRIRAGGKTVALASSSPADAFGAACFDDGGVARWLAQGRVPPASSVEDDHGRAEGVLEFSRTLGPSASFDVFVTCGAPGVDPLPFDAGQAQARMTAAVDAWRLALPLHDAVDAATPAFEVAVTAVAHVLACRDGAALQPGPRRYTRSWIRDGAIMAGALARAGRADAATAFVEWYAPFQRGDGFVPCCVDRDGVDPLVEHDSHGQLVHATAETFRFTRDVAFARRLWPHCVRAAGFIEQLRATRRTPAFATGERRACYGLLPESVSHEGYLAQPVHAYWDDFWALRGLRDAAFLARELGFDDEAPRWSAAADDLESALGESIRQVAREHRLDTVPASVEWADFDPTAIAGAVALAGCASVFADDALATTFDRYMEGFRARREPSSTWSNYSPYEARIVGALVRMGRRDDANALLDGLLADCRPHGWNQWPEILWRDAAAPAHLGDLPHCWIGAEYFVALRTMLLYEREEDGALVVGAGLRRQWIDAGLVAKGLPTWWGTVDLDIRRDGDSVRVVVGGSAKPPGGVVLALP